MYRPSGVPDHAQARHVPGITVGEFHDSIIYTWKTDAGETMAYKMPISSYDLIEVFEMGSREPVAVFPNVGFSPPPPPKSVEPPSLFAKRELTEDELLDPGLFCKSVYEPELDRIVR